MVGVGRVHQTEPHALAGDDNVLTLSCDLTEVDAACVARGGTSKRDEHEQPCGVVNVDRWPVADAIADLVAVSVHDGWDEPILDGGEQRRLAAAIRADTTTKLGVGDDNGIAHCLHRPVK